MLMDFCNIITMDIGKNVKMAWTEISLNNCGSGAAVFQRHRLVFPKSSPMSVLKSPWKMNREALLEELNGYRVVVHPQWTVPELRQTVIEQREVRYPKEEANPAKGLTKMSLSELVQKAIELNVEMPPKPTRGLLQKLIRDQVQPPGEHVMTFGKFRGWLYQEVPEEYMEWAIRERKANTNCSPDLILFVNWATVELQRRYNKAKEKGGYRTVDDPEVKAVVPPPDLASVRSWRSSTESSVSAMSSKGREKRAHVEEEFVQVRAMMPDMTEEEKKEPEELETKLAMIKQKHQLPPRGQQG